MLSRSGIFELPRTPLAHNDANYAVAMGSNTDRLVWIDCEMTGLDPESDEIVEIACIVTDAELIKAVIGTHARGERAGPARRLGRESEQARARGAG